VIISRTEAAAAPAARMPAISSGVFSESAMIHAFERWRLSPRRGFVL
jgi:hypothetical protein